MQEVVLQLCGGEQAVLPKPALLTGTRNLLNSMALEDVVCDAPKAADWVSSNACLHKLPCHTAKLFCITAESLLWREVSSDDVHTPSYTL